MEGFVQYSNSIGFANSAVVAPRRKARDASSLQLIETIEELGKLGNEIAALQQLILINREDELSNMKALYSSADIENKIEMIDKLCNHIKKVIDNKNRIITHLQQPFAGEYIIIEAKHQSEFLELIRQMCTDLYQLDRNVSCLLWVANFNAGKDKLEAGLDQISGEIAKRQRFYETLQQLRDAIQQFNTIV